MKVLISAIESDWAAFWRIYSGKRIDVIISLEWAGAHRRQNRRLSVTGQRIIRQLIKRVSQANNREDRFIVVERRASELNCWPQ